MSDITLITPTDKIYSSEISILLVYPSNKIKEQIQQVLAEIDQPVHLYLYEINAVPDEVEWLLDVQALCDYTVIDVDNCTSGIRSIVSYMISKDNTFWLTNGAGTYYNVISKNRIFNLDFLKKKLGGTLEKKQQK